MKKKLTKEKAEEIRQIIEKELELFFKDKILVCAIDKPYLKFLKNNEKIDIYHDPKINVVLESDLDPEYYYLNYSCWIQMNYININKKYYEEKAINFDIEIWDLHGNTNIKKYIRNVVMKELVDLTIDTYHVYVKSFVEKKPTKLKTTSTRLKKLIGDNFNLTKKDYTDLSSNNKKECMICDISEFCVSLKEPVNGNQKISYSLYESYSFETNEKMKFIQFKLEKNVKF